MSNSETKTEDTAVDSSVPSTADAPLPLDPCRFPEAPCYNHIWATVLFVLHLACYFAIQALVLPEVIEYLQFGSSDSSSMLRNLSPLFALLIATLAALIVSILYLLLIQALPVFTFWMTVILFNMISVGA